MNLNKVLGALDKGKNIWLKIGDDIGIGLTPKEIMVYANLRLRVDDMGKEEYKCIPLAQPPLLEELAERPDQEQFWEKIALINQVGTHFGLESASYVNAVQTACQEDAERLERTCGRFRGAKKLGQKGKSSIADDIAYGFNWVYNLCWLTIPNYRARKAVHIVAGSCLGWMVLDRTSGGFAGMLEKDAKFLDGLQEDCAPKAACHARQSHAVYERLSRIAGDAAGRFIHAVENMKYTYEEKMAISLRLPDLEVLADEIAKRIGYRKEKAD